MAAEHIADSSPSIPFLCLPQLLEYHAKRLPDAPAILAPGRAPLSYGRLYRQIEEMGCALRAMGIGRHDRVAVILPNGPELVTAILTVAANAMCAPMNPAYGARELEGYFADLRPRALLTTYGIDSPARRVALAQGVRIIELRTEDAAEAGLFTLTGDAAGRAFHDPISPDDVMLLLFTSGTTARPKIVPLTHANICRSAYSSAATLALGSTDRCLNVLPLFHGHGLNATVMASVAAGASVVATPGCDVKSFFGWLTTFQPTWYSAVPTMHQAILAQARHHLDHVAAHRLRLIRSASAPLAPRVLADLERLFDAPVIEFYGMTETASSPIACNPLPPSRRKAGSVGIPVDLPVAIMGSDGNLLPGSETGEVVVRGESVVLGYDNDPAANQAAFVGGWFKTGDLGFFDDDGYLFLTGRSKEIINRGGEKITPWEVDEVLLEHPAVAEAVTFAVPHPTLGEEVGAAVVLRPQIAATPKEIRQFVIGRVADFKVPRQVLIVKELPRGPTGKVNRIGLATALGVDGGVPVPQAFVAPSAPLEKVLAERWAEILKVERVGIHDDFFALGGDSLLVAHLVADVYDTMQLEIDVSRFFAAPTVAETAHYLETLIQAGHTRRPSSVIAPRPQKDAVPASIAQERLWQLQRVLRGMPFFNVFCPLRLTSAFDVRILERSINEIVQRHEILRTTFGLVDGRCVQVIAPQQSVDLAFDDLDSLPESEQETAGHKIIEEAALFSFDLTQGPLFRVRLLRVAEQEHLLLITLHGIIVDGWSLGVLVEELFAAYDALSVGAALPPSPLTIQYADFAHWQRHWRSQPDIVGQLSYWREQLRGPLPAMRLGTPPSGQIIDRFRTAQLEVMLPARLFEAAKSFSLREGGTLYMTLVAALKTLLQRYLGQDDLRVATLVANRNRPGTDRIVGPLANTVILRTNLGGDPSLREVMHRVRATTLAALAHQDLPFEELVEAMESGRGLKQVAQVMIALHNASLRPIASSGHAITFEEANPNMLGPLVTPMAFDINLMLRESPDGLSGSCIYKSHLFDAMTIGRLLRDFQEVLQLMVTQSERPVSSVCVSLHEEASNPDIVPDFRTSA
jgi:acyl-CoA synthetase (AMP-forming)/AMP-acid ligase II